MGTASATKTRPAGGGLTELDAATALIHLSRLVQCVQADISEEHGLTPVQAKLLCVLATGPRKMVELARGFGVEKAALTGLIDRAERRGLVQRSSVPGDRRASAVSLTDEGRIAAKRFHRQATNALNDLLAPLTRSERDALRLAMTHVIAESQHSAAAIDGLPRS